jgi:hypothetical protein
MSGDLRTALAAIRELRGTIELLLLDGVFLASNPP